MIGSSRSASIGKYENALGPVHECVGISHASRWRARLQFLATIGQADEAFGPTGHLCNSVGTKSFDDGIEGGRDRRHGPKQLECLSSDLQCFFAVDRIAVGVGARPRAFIAVVIADDLHRSEESRVGNECVSTRRSRWTPYH